MDISTDFYTAPMPDSPYNRARLLEEIAYMEARLRAIGQGDCAYERSLARTYAVMIHTRRRQLAATPVS